MVCEYGILDVLYGAGDLEEFHGLIEYDHKKIVNSISLTGAAIKVTNGKRETAISEIEITCDCKGKCSDRRCKSFNAKQKCNSHFHGKNSQQSSCFF